MCCACGGGETVTTLIFACDDDTACNYGEIAACTYAAEGFDCDGNSLCAGTDVSMGGGSWISETSWSITSCDGSIIASGAGSESTSCVDLPSDYIVTMTDSYLSLIHI